MSERHSLIQGTVIRATLIDECGAPVGGACSTVTSECFAKVSMSDNVEAPTEYKAKTAADSYCINQRAQPKLNWIEVSIQVWEVDPVMIEMLTGSPLIYDDSTPPVAVGFGTDESAYASASFALEVWTNVARPVGGAACGAAGTRYGYLLLPWLLEGTIGNVDIENAPVSFTLNAITSGGNDWGVGPYDVVEDNTSTPSPLLTAIPTDRHRLVQFTTLAPPAAVGGCEELLGVES